MTQDGETLAQLDSIKESEISFKLEVLQEGYLGETSDRYDEILKGVTVTFTAHTTGPTVFDIIQAVVDRATRRTPGTKFNFKTTLQWPNGQRRRVVINDVSFGEIPTTLPDRGQYAALKFSLSASTGKFI